MPEKKKFKNIVEKQKYWDGLIDLYGSGVKGRQNYIDNYDQVIKGSSGVLNKYRIQDTDLSKLPHDLKTIKKRYDSYRDRYDKIESDNTLGYDEKDKLPSKYSRLIDKSASEWDSNKSNQLKYNTKDTSWRTLLNRKDIKNKALFYASLMDEGADKFMADEESQQAPYEGFGTFGLDTAASRIDEFIDKGYINKDIKDRVIHERPRTNEKNESVYPLSYTNLDDVVSMKNAYFKEGEAIINKFEKDNKIKLSPRARDYFTIVSFNRGPGGVKEVMRDYLNAGILENDRFMEDDSFPKYREAHRNAKRRLETADMLRGEGIIEYGKGGAFDPVSMGIDLGLQALTAIGGSIGANMAAERENMYNEAADNLQTVDIKSATRGSGLQSFLQNPLSFGIGGRKKARLEAEEFNKNILKQIRNKNIASRFSTMSDAPTYTPVARQGGFIAYKGQTHEGPDGGILVDKFGNPTSISEGETVASVEGGGKNKKGEVSYYDPDSGSTYIYSDSLNFAKPARDLLSKYKLDDPDSLQYKQYKNDLLTQTMIKKKFENLTKAQEFAKETESSAEDSLNIFKKGGYLTSSKAKKMLKDGTAHGKKLTPKQKRYFGWVAGGRKEAGGPLDYDIPMYKTGYEGDVKGRKNWRDFFGYRNPNSTGPLEDIGNFLFEPMVTSVAKDKLEDLSKIKGVDYGLVPGVGGFQIGVRPYGRKLPQSEIVSSKPARLNSLYEVPTLEVNPTLLPNQLPSAPKLNLPSGFANISGFYDRKIYDSGPGYYTKGYKREYNVGNAEPNVAVESITPKPGTATATPKPTSPIEEPATGMNPFFFDMYRRSIRDRQIGPQPSTEETPYNALSDSRNNDGYIGSTSWLNPLGHILGAAGSLADYYALRDAKPTDFNLGRVGSERISLARQRLSNIRNTAAAKSMAASAARSSGMNAGVALSNTLAANTGANRLLGQQNAELLEKEELYNAQMRQQANMMNAELAAQEELYNQQQRNAYKMMMAKANPLGNLARTAASYFRDNAAYQTELTNRELLAPNAELYRDPDAGWLKRTFGPRQYKFIDKGLYSIDELKKLGIVND